MVGEGVIVSDGAMVGNGVVERVIVGRGGIRVGLNGMRVRVKVVVGGCDVAVYGINVWVRALVGIDDSVNIRVGS